MRALLRAKNLAGLAAPPYVLTRLAAFVGLSPAQQAQWWQAWKRAETPAAVALRQHLLFFDETRAQRPQARHMIHQVCAGTALVQVCEALVDEHLLSRPDATAIEDCIFQALDAQGHWRDH
jgi:hypothetical protein